MVVFRRPWLLALCFLPAAPASFALGGAQAFEGMALGLVGGAFGAIGLRLATRLVAVAGTAQAPARLGVVATMIVFVAKLPVILSLMYLAVRIGGAAPVLFIVGLTMVYSALIGWALATG